MAWTVGFQWWHSGDITRTQNVSEYMLVLALCLVRQTWTNVKAVFKNALNMSMSILVANSDLTTRDHVITTSIVCDCGVFEEML